MKMLALMTISNHARPTALEQPIANHFVVPLAEVEASNMSECYNIALDALIQYPALYERWQAAGYLLGFPDVMVKQEHPETGLTYWTAYIPVKEHDEYTGAEYHVLRPFLMDCYHDRGLAVDGLGTSLKHIQKQINDHPGAGYTIGQDEGFGTAFDDWVNSGRIVMPNIISYDEFRVNADTWQRW